MARVHSAKIDLNSEDPAEVLLNRHFLGILRNGYGRYGPNRVCLPTCYDRVVDRILDLEVKDSDIFTISFPKSGSTWTMEMVWCIANDLDFKGAETLLDLRGPFLDHSALFDFTTLMSENPTAYIPDYLINSISTVEKMKSPRFIKTHFHWELLPRQIQSGAKKPKIVYVMRNPKDLCVSTFHHCRNFIGYTGNFDEFVTLFTENLIYYAPYWCHLQTYWSHRNDLDILFVRYEDMKKDLRQVIRQVATFLNKTLTEEQISALEQHLSFESIKNNPAVNHGSRMQKIKEYKLHYRDDSEFIREGQVGNYKSLMTPEHVEKINRWIEANVDEEFRDVFKDYLI